MTARPTHPGAFLPRPIYEVKPYVYLAEAGDTAESITEKLGRPRADYHELVAANMTGRDLRPMPLGSPFGCRTFAEIEENERLKIPAHWPDVDGELGVGVGGGETVGLGVVVMDPVAQSIMNVLSGVAAAGGGPSPPYSPEMVSAAANAAVSWWQAQNGTGGTPNPTAYLPYVNSALGWAAQVVPGVLAQGVAPAQIGSFPWGAVISMLPAMPDFSKVDWSNGTIPGSNGVPWSALPWGYLAQLGTDLEKLKLGQIKWPTNVTPESVLDAFKKVLADAVGSGQAEYVCGQNSEVRDGACVCKDGYTWASTTDISNLDCVPLPAPTQTTPPPPPSGQAPSCPSGAVYDPGAAVPGCYECPAGSMYSLVTHKCEAPTQTKPSDLTNVTGETETKIGPGAIALGALGLLVLGGVAVYATSKAVEEPKGKRASNPRRK